ncbi:MAG: VWA domain-containing protein, partial [bacterium]|nr:VWA domain-containing protein [bacterium]
NSMNEELNGRKKIHIAMDTLSSILPKINPEIQTGLRVYGHRAGLTYLQGCMASKLTVPLARNNAQNILNSIYKTQATGWTPITYSLKQAVNSDFAGVEGRKHIILLTDGGENCDESPCTYAIELMKLRDDISIDVIAFDLYDVEANNQLKCTALATRGKFYSANDSNALTNSLFDSLGIDKAVHGTIKMNN